MIIFLIIIIIIIKCFIESAEQLDTYLLYIILDLNISFWPFCLFL